VPALLPLVPDALPLAAAVVVELGLPEVAVLVVGVTPLLPLLLPPLGPPAIDPPVANPLVVVVAALARPAVPLNNTARHTELVAKVRDFLVSSVC
jgi:hypothetical protein